MERLFALTTRSRILSNIWYRTWTHNVHNPLFEFIQLVLTHWSFDLSLHNETHFFQVSQHAVYASPNDHPLLYGPNKDRVNVGFLLHVVNFFKYHLTTSVEQTAIDAYRRLASNEKFKAWNEPLAGGLKELGSTWKTSYGALHNGPNGQLYGQMRGLIEPPRVSFEDDLGMQDGKFHTLDLEFSGVSPPPAFQNFPEMGLPSGGNYHSFAGFGREGGKQFQCVGTVSPLPDQKKIPGWQRVSMVKHKPIDPNAPRHHRLRPRRPTAPPTPVTAPSSADYGSFAWHLRADGSVDFKEALDNQVWCYEGVVLPGGMIMLGRWWGPLGQIETGPWIAWRVGGEDCGSGGGGAPRRGRGGGGVEAGRAERAGRRERRREAQQQ
ncbi:hypothetical protein MMC14_005996 [Varicellaria rhodocarpa]|nr:hypothetical protein [Varicellaria rhodocarpa]